MSKVATKRGPFHETVVDAMGRASTPEAIGILCYLIRNTEIPKGHEAIVDALVGRVDELDFTEDFGRNVQEVLDSLAEQKEASEQEDGESKGS